MLCVYYHKKKKSEGEILARFFVDIDKIILKVKWKGKGTRMAKTKFEKEELSGKNQPTHFQDLKE